MKSYNILIFGDSITYGAWDKEKGGWVNRLRLAYETSQPDNRYNIFNLGISGENVLEIANRFECECLSRIKSDRQNIIIIAIGINDSQIRNETDYVSKSEFKSTLTHIVKKAKSYTKDVLLIGLTPVDEALTCPRPSSPYIYYYNKRILEYDDIIKDIAQNQNVAYQYAYDIFPKEDLYDGLHPNAIGHQKMCDVIKEKLDTLLEI